MHGMPHSVLSSLYEDTMLKHAIDLIDKICLVDMATLETLIHELNPECHEDVHAIKEQLWTLQRYLATYTCAGEGFGDTWGQDTT
jgi:hypothetical protein